MSREHFSFHRSPGVPAGLPAWRSRLVVLLLTLGFLALVARAAWVQVAHREFFVEQGRRRYERTFSAVALRSKILDRRGNVLAISEPVDDLWLDPQDFARATPGQVGELAAALHLSPASVDAFRRRGGRFAPLRRAVPLDVARPLLASAIPGLHAIAAQKRYFPEGDALVQVIGITGRDGAGLEGVELAGNAALRGQAASRTLIVDRLGRAVTEPRDSDLPEPQPDLVLSIDRQIQRLTQEALARGVERTAAAAGCAIAVDVASGEILALANVPSFDPNDPGALAGGPPRNRALTDTFEPGSTIKPLTVSLALADGLITPGTRFDTSPGVLEFHGARIRDTSDHGVIDTGQVIAKSSNIGMVKISQLLSAQAMWDNFRRFGLGGVPLEGFPGVVSGTLRNPHRWGPVEQATMSYGYGLSVSLAQLARAYVILANDGHATRLSLLHEMPDLRDARPGAAVIPAAVAARVRAMLEETVAPGGTATMARLPDYRVGAKTGTARKSDGRHGYAAGQYRAVFVGMAPMSRPRVVVAVMIDTPRKVSYYGGPVAGPVFAAITEGALHVLGVPPDRVPSRLGAPVSSRSSR
ncbi:peptidoglycan D,D-transpeptidase FtsI family protein [Burkholderia gladioli]|uniref:peptidoglycan D,D-transpeptidase FtsI family protein n=1 Tax=Burkholderia gladioli TaxID=28095 RepID=UPI001640C78F|nr:penicillin-binding protein 2 [Burkholderia gladioli]